MYCLNGNRHACSKEKGIHALIKLHILRMIYPSSLMAESSEIDEAYDSLDSALISNLRVLRPDSERKSPGHVKKMKRQG